MKTGGKAILRKIAIPLVLLLFAGCAPGLDYKALDRQIFSGDCAGATGLLEKSKKRYGRNGRLLFLMDAGAVNMYCRRHEASNRYLHDAETLAEELWTKSITRGAASFLLNDYTIPYRGEDFEQALINMLSAINYAAMGQYGEALVECRRLNSKLVLFNEKYEKKNVYREDAFGRYLSGMIYEAEGVNRLENIDSAFIDYDRAFTVAMDYASDYGTPVPRVLVEDYLRIAEAADRLREARARAGRIGKIKWMNHRKARKLGKIVFIHLNGRAPVKEEERVVISTRSGPVKLALPKYVVTRPRCRNSELAVEAGGTETISARAELVEDIAGIALKNLEDRMGRIVAKAIARAVTKRAVAHGATRDIKDPGTKLLARAGLDVMNWLTERADTRAWRTLPAEIYMTRVFVPAGEYRVSATLCGNTRELAGSVSLKAGETRFLLLDTVY